MIDEDAGKLLGECFAQGYGVIFWRRGPEEWACGIWVGKPYDFWQETILAFNGYSAAKELSDAVRLEWTRVRGVPQA